MILNAQKSLSVTSYTYFATVTGATRALLTLFLIQNNRKWHFGRKRMKVKLQITLQSTFSESQFFELPFRPSLHFKDLVAS
jgi:hypothetical protein